MKTTGPWPRQTLAHIYPLILFHLSTITHTLCNHKSSAFSSSSSFSLPLQKQKQKQQMGRLNLILVWSLTLTLCLCLCPTFAQLSPNHYAKTCPNLESIVRGVVQRKFQQTFVTVPATLRLFFHDCFVQVINFIISTLYKLFSSSHFNYTVSCWTHQNSKLRFEPNASYKLIKQTKLNPFIASGLKILILLCLQYHCYRVVMLQFWCNPPETTKQRRITLRICH